MTKMRNSLTQVLFFLFVWRVYSLKDVTDRIFKQNHYGFIAAFGDFNSDKHTDIFIINEKGE